MMCDCCAFLVIIIIIIYIYIYTYTHKQCCLIARAVKATPSDERDATD
jgi:hypothetical protein